MAVIGSGCESQLLTAIIYSYILVGGFKHIEKYESQWEGLSHILWKKCLKPATSI